MTRAVPRLLAKRWLSLLCLLLLIPLVPRSSPTRAAPSEPPSLPPQTRGADADFFGIVGRDPWFEWNTDPVNYPNDVNKAALEGMARDLAFAGAGWVRIELRADHDGNAQGGPGYIDYRKWDWFIEECAPKYGLKVLLLLGSAVIDHSSVDPTVSFSRINDPADRPDDTNNYVRLYTARAQEIADHFGDRVAAYEILNEANISEILHTESGGTQAEFNPQNYGALLTDTYIGIKAAHPRVQVIVGGLLYGFRPNGGSADYDYLYVLYKSKRIQEYRAANGRYPFDGVASHAYYVGTARAVVDHYWQLRGVMESVGDTTSKLWLTEIGAEGTPPTVDPSYLTATPTRSEEEQAAFMRELFSLLLTEVRGFVANVFWFKYEDFALPNSWVDYGLVRLPITSGGAYAQPPTPRKLAFAAFQRFANPGGLPTAPESPNGLPASGYYFPQTRHTISGAFRQYWENTGGLTRFGYPITSVFEANGLRVQYFERARFEYHPENDADNQVQLGLLTGFLTQGRTFPQGTPITPTPAPRPAGTPTAATPTFCPSGATCAPAPTATATIVQTPTATATPSTIYFAQTGHNLGGAFYTYWRTSGGLASYGYPISEEVREKNQADGKDYTVQYFERARLEYHPENAGTPYVVLLGLMGTEVLNTNGWYR